MTMKTNDEILLRTLLAAGDAGLPESQFPFAAQKRLQDLGLVRYPPGTAAEVAIRPLLLTPSGRRVAAQLAATAGMA